ncbi:MAG: hypothetical protein HZA52_06655 [Planctomycetes bacterium]|nr:hypothetical protein [Planctomycetota bacterium]
MAKPIEADPRGGVISKLVQVLIGVLLLVVVVAVLVASLWPGARPCPIAAVPGWCWLAALIPSVIVAQHALYLFIVRASQLLDRGRRLWPFESLVSLTATGATSQGRTESRSTNSGDESSSLCAANDGDRTQTLAYRRAVERSVDREFDGIVLLLRFGVPAVLMLLVLLAWMLRLLKPDDPLLSPEMKSAAWIGLSGAYCYTLLQLGQRAFVRDITNGVATWCALTLVLGPMLAILLTKLGLESVTADGTLPSGQSNGSAVGGLLLAVHFVAGFSPRYVIETIFEGVRKRTGYMSSANVVARGVPLTDVRGIVPEVAERLGEEGISDVAGLSLADPVRLLRNTAYDKRQVLGWIDEAILIVTMPEHWQAIEKQGITGAIDLAWCSCVDAKGAASDAARDDQAPASNAIPPATHPAGGLAAEALAAEAYAAAPQAAVPQAPAREPEAACAPPIARLAAVLNFDACTLNDISKRLFEDAQVGMIWALYQARPNDE